VLITLSKISYMWGIHENESINSPFMLFKSAVSPLAGPVNSFQVFFKVNNVVPEGSKLLFKLSTGGTGVLEHSIITNLPVDSNSKKVSCYFDSSTLNICCSNVGAFLDPSTQYFLAAKIFYSSSASNPGNFGGISITSTVYDKNGVAISGVSLF